jgi:dolichyl-diphosphooligosaccharide--protein glycosyltransferase
MKLLQLLKKYRIDVIIVLALFFLAFGIRTMTVDKFPDIYGFDSFWGAKITKNIIEKGWLWDIPPYDMNQGFNDTTTLYPYGRLTTPPIEGGWWGLAAVTYKITAFMNGISGFNYNLFGHVASWLNAIVGALAIPAIYLFGRTAWNRWVGLSCALFLAASNNHLFYSIFGHAENDALGFSLFFLALFAFVLTVKSKDWRIGLLTTFFFGWLSFTWRSYDVVVLLVSGTIAMYFILYYVMNQVGYYKNSPERDKERKWMIYALCFVLAAIAINMPFEWRTSAITIGAAGFAILICSLIEIYGRKIAVTKENLSKEPILKIACVVAVIIAVSYFLPHFGISIINTPLNYVGIHLEAPFTPPDYTQRMDTTIAEQNPIAGNNFLERLDTVANQGAGVSIWLALMGAIFIMIKLSILPFMRKDFAWQWDIMALVFILFSMYSLTSKAVTMFFLAGAVAFGAGYFVGELVHLVEYFGKYYEKYKTHAKVAVFSLMMLLFFGFNTMIIPGAEGFGYDVYPEWVNLFAWVNNSLPQGSVITAWWDYGHWLSYYDGDRISVTTDNAQYAPSIYTTALAFTHTSNCSISQNQVNCDSSPGGLEEAEIEALSTLKPMGTTHILIDKEIVLGKFTALETIANNWLGIMTAAGCQRLVNESVVCIVGKNQDGQNVGPIFSAEQWEQLKNTPWPGTSLASQGMPTRAFAREDHDGLVMYITTQSTGNGYLQFDPNSPVIFSFEHRLFFKDPNLKHVKLVYDDGWNVIYEINWKGIPDPKDSVLPNWQENDMIFNQRYGV